MTASGHDSGPRQLKPDRKPDVPANPERVRPRRDLGFGFLAPGIGMSWMDLRRPQQPCGKVLGLAS